MPGNLIPRSWGRAWPGGFRVPTLFRLLIVIALIAALAYGTMLAMVTFLHPPPHEIVQTIQLPPSK